MRGLQQVFIPSPYTPTPMKILLTGADGAIGHHLCGALAAAGHTVTATDIRQTRPPRTSLQLCDLLNRESVRTLVAGHEAVLHFGAHAAPGRLEDKTRLYLENVTMTAHLVDASIAAGVRKFIFASSIQVANGALDAGGGRLDNPAPSLPIDATIPPRPRNLYGLSKQAGEALLQQAADRHPLDAIALRLPLTLRDDGADLNRAIANPEKESKDVLIAILSVEELDRLVEAILQTPLPGYRCYQPALRRNILGLPPHEVWQRHLAHLPLKDPTRPLNTLVDLSRITAETRWSPAS